MARHRPAYIAFALTTVALFLAADGLALGRDADGSRMQARAMSAGSSVSDRLSPPGDVVDWRYVRIHEEKALNVQINAKPANAAVRVSLTDAVGKSLGTATTKQGSATVRRKADPGLYYISVSSNQAVSYTLTVR